MKKDLDDSKPQNGGGFYITISMEAALDERLHDSEKVLLGHIANLSNKHGHCWASNKHIAEVTSKHETTISKSISRLIKFGYLHSEMIVVGVGFQRHLTMVSRPIPQTDIKAHKPRRSRRAGQEPLGAQANIIIKVNNQKNNQIRRVSDESIKTLHHWVNAIRRQYGHKTELQFTETKNNLFRSLLKKYPLEQLQDLTEFRCKQLAKPEFIKYMVPETIFRKTKIEGWLEQMEVDETAKESQLYQSY